MRVSGFLLIALSWAFPYAGAFRPANRGQGHALLQTEDHRRITSEVQGGFDTKATDRWQLYTESTGPKLSDIKQGVLGNCYFLASLGAVVRTYPELIREMFVSKDLAKGIYVTRFFIFGQDIEVAVNDQIPLGLGGQMLYSAPNDGYDLWPAILEKAWAKIHGSYAKVEGGWGWDGLNSITRAPTDVIEERSRMWDAIKEAVEKKRPCVLASATNAKIIFPSHAYVLVDVSEAYQANGTQTPPRAAVHIYNPHASNSLNSASFENDKGSGYFWLTKEEFLKSFMRVSVARFSPSFKVTSVPLKTVTNEAGSPQPRAFDFEIKKNKAAILLYWPSQRLFPGDCRPHGRVVFVAYKVKSDGKTFGKALEFAAFRDHSARIDLPGPGKYRVFVQMHYKTEAFKRYRLNFYATDVVEYKEVTRQTSQKNMTKGVTGIPALAWIELGQELNRESEPIAEAQANESNVQCTDALINARVDRLKTLNNVDRLAAGQDDDEFPENSNSVGASMVQPEKWERIKSVMEDTERNLEKIKKCVSAWRKPGQAGKCSYEVIHDCPDRADIRVNGQVAKLFMIYTNECAYLDLPPETFENRQRLAQAACGKKVFAENGQCKVSWVRSKNWHECEDFTYSCEVPGGKPVSFVIKSVGTINIPVLKPDKDGNCICKRPEHVTMQALEKQWLDALKGESTKIEMEIAKSKRKEKEMKKSDQEALDAAGGQTEGQKKEEEQELEKDIKNLEQEEPGAKGSGELDKIKEEEREDQKKLDDLKKDTDKDEDQNQDPAAPDLETHLDEHAGGDAGDVDKNKNEEMTEEERQHLLKEQKDELDREKNSLEEQLLHDKEQKEEENKDERQSEQEDHQNADVIRQAIEGDKEASKDDQPAPEKKPGPGEGDGPGAKDGKSRDDIETEGTGVSDNGGKSVSDSEKHGEEADQDKGGPSKPEVGENHGEKPSEDADKAKLEEEEEEERKAEQERLEKMEEEKANLEKKLKEEELEKQKLAEELAEQEERRKEVEEKEKQRLEMLKAEHEKEERRKEMEELKAKHDEEEKRKQQEEEEKRKHQEEEAKRKQQEEEDKQKKGNEDGGADDHQGPGEHHPADEEGTPNHHESRTDEPGELHTDEDHGSDIDIDAKHHNEPSEHETDEDGRPNEVDSNQGPSEHHTDEDQHDGESHHDHHHTGPGEHHANEDHEKGEHESESDDHKEPGHQHHADEDERCFALGKVDNSCYVINLCSTKIHVQVKEVQYYYRANRVRKEPLASCDLFPDHAYAYMNYEKEITGAKCVVGSEASDGKCDLKNECVAPVEIDGQLFLPKATIEQDLSVCNKMHQEGHLKHMKEMD